MISTLLPHLPHRRTAPFRVVLGASLVLLAALGLLRLTGPAIAVAVLAVPLLYLIYLYEVEVYEDEPVLLIGATFAVGLVLGIPWALITGPQVTVLPSRSVTATLIWCWPAVRVVVSRFSRLLVLPVALVAACSVMVTPFTAPVEAAALFLKV